MAYFQDLCAQFRRFPTAIRYFYLTDMLFAFSVSIFGTLFNLHLLSIGYTADHVGQLQAVSAILMAAVAIPIGLTGDRWNRRTLYIAGSLFFGLPYIVLPWVSQFPVLMAVQAMSALGHTLMQVNESGILAGEVDARQRASVFSFMMINFFVWQTVATQLAGFLADWLPAGPSTVYQWPLVIAGVCGVVSGIGRALLPFRKQEPVGRRLNLRPSRITVKLALAAILSSVAMSLTMHFSNVILASRFGYPASTISTVLMVAGTLGWLGSLLVPWSSSRIGNMRGAVTMIGLQGFALMAMGLAGQPVGFLPAFWSRAILGNMQASLWMAFVMDVTAEDERATAQAYIICARSIGTAAAARGFGAALAAGSFVLPFTVASLFAFATAAFIFFTFRKQALTATAVVRA